MIRAVFFDLYGTLSTFNPPREKVQAQACAQFGLQVTPQGILRGYALADDLMARQNASEPLRAMTDGARLEFFARYEQAILRGAGHEVAPDLAGRVWQRVREIPYHMVLYGDVLLTLDALRSTGYTVGVISNLNRESGRLMERMGLAGHVDLAVTSMEVGAEKPHAPIFLAALEKAGAAPHEAVHAGDQVASDVEGARAVGIQPVLVDRDGTAPPVDCPRIRRLPDMQGVLDGVGRGGG